MSRADLGAAVDIEAQLGEYGVSLLAGLGASLGKLADSIDAIRRMQEDYARRGPLDVPLRASVTTNASGGGVVLGLGGPSVNRLWILRRLVIGGAAWSSTMGGTANVYVSPVQPSAGSGTLADIVDQASSLPNKAFYTSRLVVLHNPAQLWVELVSPTASTLYVVGGAAEDLPDEAEKARAAV